MADERADSQDCHAEGEPEILLTEDTIAGVPLMRIEVIRVAQHDKYPSYSVIKGSVDR